MQTEQDIIRDVILNLGGLQQGQSGSVIRALNVLMVRTADADRDSLHLENYPALLTNIMKLLDALNPIADLVKVHAKKINFAPHEWSNSVFPICDDYAFQQQARALDYNAVLLSVLCVIRNLSFERMNEAYIGFSTTIIKHLVSLLLVSLDYLSECSRYAFDILANIGKKIDVSNALRSKTDFYLENCVDFKNRAALHLSLTSDLSSESNAEYSYFASLVCPALLKFLQQTTDRFAAIRGLDLISKLASVKENRIYFETCPDDFLEIVVEMLCISHTGLEPIHLEKDTERPPPTSGPYNEQVDMDIRNGAIEALHMLSSYYSLRLRIASVPHCMQILKRIICLTDKKDVTPKLCSLLSNLAQHPGTYSMFLAMQEDLYLSAMSDDTVADLVCSSLWYVFSRTDTEVLDPSAPLI